MSAAAGTPEWTVSVNDLGDKVLLYVAPVMLALSAFEAHRIALRLIVASEAVANG